jgi:hypothetical protein
MLLGTSDLDGKFSFKTGSAGGTVDAMDVFVLCFSTYKMKDRIDEGIFEISFRGSRGTRTYIDDSTSETQVKSVYNLVSGSLENGIVTGASYDGVGLLYPQNGILVLNAEKLNDVVGLKTANFNSDGGAPGAGYNYNSSSFTTEYTQNHKVIYESILAAGVTNSKLMKIRKTEYVPARHYFVRVKNRDFNYSNNPTYVYDSGENKGKIKNACFIDNPMTYITTVGLYNSKRDLIAVAKLSRPIKKTKENDVLIKIRLNW